MWLLKSALKGIDFVPQDLEDPVGRANYSSVNNFVSQARATFMEEVDLGMVEGPLTKQQAATRCQCQPEDLCPGSVAAIDEGDKVRTIYDGSVGGANHHIQTRPMNGPQLRQSLIACTPSAGVRRRVVPNLLVPRPRGMGPRLCPLAMAPCPTKMDPPQG